MAISTSDPVQSYRERLPAPQLANLVSSMWFLEVDAAAAAYEHRTVPNGSVEISYELGSDVVHVSGPQRGPTVVRVEPGAILVGARLRPGAAPSIVGAPISELVDLQVEADRLWGGGAATLAVRLGEAGSPMGAARVLEEDLVRRIAQAPVPDPLVSAAAGRLQPWIPHSVGARTADLFLSPRQLRRRFAAALGYGPKTLQRILRFQGFLALAQGQHGTRVSLARLAQRAGYSDQAHLTRESSGLTGLTPRAFLEEMWRSCGPTHDHAASFAGLRRALLSARPPLVQQEWAA